MVEYLYNAVMATSGDEVVINAYITNENEELITENCNLVIYDGTTNEVIVIVNGLYDTDASVWDFVVS
jgi:aspartate 1-decarboxylase